MCTCATWADTAFCLETSPLEERVQRSNGAVLLCTSAPRHLRSLGVWQRAVIGLACVSNSSQQVHSMLMHAIRAMENWRLDAEVVDYCIELL